MDQVVGGMDGKGKPITIAVDQGLGGMDGAMVQSKVGLVRWQQIHKGHPRQVRGALLPVRWNKFVLPRC